MVKKILFIILSIGLMFSVINLVGCTNSSLEKYKESKTIQLQNYANSKEIDNYSQTNWLMICNAVEVGKQAIEEATSKSAVTKAFNDAKDLIDEVGEKMVELTEELESRIKADYLEEFGHELFFGDELLNKFYGIYNGAAVFFIAGCDAWLKSVTIADVEFSYNYDWIILVWKNGNFYNLENIETIFEANILTQADLEQIGKNHIEST